MTKEWPPLSNEFCLPLAVNLSPRPSIAAILIAAHCLPLPLLPWAVSTGVVGAAWAWLIAAAAGISLALELRKQCAAAGALRLEVSTSGWRLHRVEHRGKTRHGNARTQQTRTQQTRDEEVLLIAAKDFGFCVLLLLAQHGRKFRVVVNARAQDREQLHRLRLVVMDTR